jgi:hypothetical protein
MSSPTVACRNCGRVLDIAPDNREPCPACGSVQRDIRVAIKDTISVGHDSLRGKMKDRRRTGKKGVVREFFTGADLHRGSGKWYHKDRVVDRENNRYSEKVINPEDGTAIHECDEPLDEHVCHGSAKTPGHVQKKGS